MRSQLQATLLSLKNSPHSTRKLDQILTQIITTGLVHTTPTWNCILRAYSKSQTPIIAIRIYNHSIKSNSILPDTFTFPSLLKACTCLHALPKGKEVHASITKIGLDVDVYVQNALIHFYGSSGQIDAAKLVFDEMSQRDIASWNSLLAAYNFNSVWRVQGFFLFKEMMDEGVKIDAITLVTILSVLAEARRAEHAIAIHSFVIKAGFSCDLKLDNALLGFYVKCGKINAAVTLYNEMGGTRDVVSHTILINGYVETGLVNLARDIFDHLVDKDIVLWNSMIHGYVEAKRLNEALGLFEEMENGMVKPDETTIVSVIAACACLSDLQYGRLVHRLILRNNMRQDVFVGTALIDMYSKCGSLDGAMLTFYKMSDKDVFSWTAAIEGLANYGYANEALKLFDLMESQGLEPNDATFASVLAACRQSGLVDEGCFFFSRMVRTYNIQPKLEHFGSLIDLLSRAGLVHQAEEFVKIMPSEESLVAYKTLLNACMSYSKIDVGLKVADELKRLGSADLAVYVLLSNFYAQAGKWSEVAEIRRKMRDFGVVKQPGTSSIEVKS